METSSSTITRSREAEAILFYEEQHLPAVKANRDKLLRSLYASTWEQGTSSQTVQGESQVPPTRIGKTSRYDQDEA